MDKGQVEYMVNRCTLPDTCSNGQLKETHISWIILTDHFAFKIKKPVSFSFLDFSTSENRKFYCRQELKLNRRLAPEMYLKVIPITQAMAGAETGGDEVLDHAVQMKRMDNSLEMDLMLKQDRVTMNHIDSLAAKIAGFHKKARVLKNAFNTLLFHNRFADIQQVSSFLAEHAGEEWRQKIDISVRKSYVYLNSIRNLSNHRVITGFQKDCHGDLNASNIFLYDEPVIFDCIEFNSDYRRIDVLNDIAFLSVDLEFFGKPEMSERFYRKYLEYNRLDDDPQTWKLFLYYKSYRANIRAKVTLMNMLEHESTPDVQKLDDVKGYISLMDMYLEDFEQ
jgi:uncharacterized protein